MKIQIQGAREHNLKDIDIEFGDGLTVVTGISGSGKTSLINAGVRPHLENMGYQTIYTRLETEPISSLCNAVARTLEIPCDGKIQSLYEFLKTVTSRTEKPLVIFLDQFEEFFTVFREQREKRKEFIDQLAKIKYDFLLFGSNSIAFFSSITASLSIFLLIYTIPRAK